MHESVRAMWRVYLATLGQTPDATVHPLSAWHFCDNQEDADACAQLVMQGCKRATAPSVAELEAAGEPMPEVGDVHVITDWAGTAQCVIRTVSVEVVPFEEVTAGHAAAEGEGDGSLAYWRRVHRDYYRRVLVGTDHEVGPRMPVVCERFEVVYPEAAHETDTVSFI